MFAARVDVLGMTWFCTCPRPSVRNGKSLIFSFDKHGEELMNQPKARLISRQLIQGKNVVLFSHCPTFRRMPLDGEGTYVTEAYNSDMMAHRYGVFNWNKKAAWCVWINQIFGSCVSVAINGQWQCKWEIAMHAICKPQPKVNNHCNAPLATSEISYLCVCLKEKYPIQ